MRPQLILGVLCAFGIAGVCAASDEADVDAARRDLAERLRLNVETVTVAPQSAASLAAAEACERVSAPVANADDEGSTLILVAEGQRHYYHARKGAAYVYCELPSTNKRGPIGAPVR